MIKLVIVEQQECRPGINSRESFYRLSAPRARKYKRGNWIARKNQEYIR